MGGVDFSAAINRSFSPGP